MSKVDDQLVVTLTVGTGRPRRRAHRPRNSWSRRADHRWTPWPASIAFSAVHSSDDWTTATPSSARMIPSSCSKPARTCGGQDHAIAAAPIAIAIRIEAAMTPLVRRSGRSAVVFPAW